MKVLFRIILLCPFISFGSVFSQEEWDFDKKNQNKPLFLDTRAINGHTVKLLEKKVLELRITHRFGEIATPQSYRTLFGLDNSSDIRIGLEYGMTENFMIGVGRSKGAGPFLEVWDGVLKLGIYKNKQRNIKITASSQLFFTSMPSSIRRSLLVHLDSVPVRPRTRSLRANSSSQVLRCAGDSRCISSMMTISQEYMCLLNDLCVMYVTLSFW